jgi:hypothetical protein
MINIYTYNLLKLDFYIEDGSSTLPIYWTMPYHNPEDHYVNKIKIVIEWDELIGYL